MTRTLASRLLAPVVLLATALGTSACGLLNEPAATPTTPATSATTTDATATPSPTPSLPVLEDKSFTTDGIGPYRFGARLDQLQAAQPGLIDVGPISECPGNTGAHGGGLYTKVELRFRADGRLYLTVNRDQAFATPSGITLGWTVEDLPDGRKGLESAYAEVLHQVLDNGDQHAFWVQVLGGSGILFVLNDAGKVDYMIASPEASKLRTNFQNKTPNC